MNSQIKSSKISWAQLILCIVVIWAAVTIVVHYSMAGGDVMISGSIGDMFGVANSLFSGLAFAGLIYTIWQQREEINAARSEQQKTVAALTRQAESLKQAARISAVTAILSSVDIRLGNMRSATEPGFYDLQARRTELLEDLEEIYDRKSAVWDVE